MIKYFQSEDKQMKINKKVVIIVVLIITLATLLYYITSIYAKYLSNTQGTASISISRWNLKVNNRQIKTNPDISSTLTLTFPRQFLYCPKHNSANG
jgi:hypothetical protein